MRMMNEEVEKGDFAMRTIDADALWKDITRNIDYCDDILEIIEKQPTIEQEQRWIPCSERLPEDKTAYYLATVANRGLFFTTTLNDNVDCVRWDYDKRKGQDSWHWCTERTVIAWMPLPEPYSEDEE